MTLEEIEKKLDEYANKGIDGPLFQALIKACQNLINEKDKEIESLKNQLSSGFIRKVPQLSTPVQFCTDQKTPAQGRLKTKD